MDTDAYKDMTKWFWLHEYGWQRIPQRFGFGLGLQVFGALGLGLQHLKLGNKTAEREHENQTWTGM